MTLRRREALTGLGYAALPVLGFAAFYIIPFGITIQKTFMDGLSGARFIGFANYRGVLGSAAFRLAVGNTLKFIIVGVPLLLGSWWGVAMIPLFFVLMVIRMRIEERTLIQGLPGYADYAARVPCRLLPRIW